MEVIHLSLDSDKNPLYLRQDNNEARERKKGSERVEEAKIEI